MSFVYTTQKDYNDEKAELDPIVKNAKTIPGTQKLHCFIPISKNSMIVK